MVATDIGTDLKDAVISFRNKLESSEDLINLKMTLQDQLVIPDKEVIIALFDSEDAGYGDKILHSKVFLITPTGLKPHLYYYRRIHDSVYEKKNVNVPFYKGELHIMSLNCAEVSGDYLTLYVRNCRGDKIVIDGSIDFSLSLRMMEL